MDVTLSGEPIVEIPGAILLSGLLQSFLLGVVITQAIKYWGDYRDDSWRKRAFVASAVVLSILQTILEGYKCWRCIVHRKLWSTSAIQWSDLFLNGALASLCEGFYIRRCWKMTNKNPWVLYLLSVLSVTIAVTNLYLAVAMGVAFHAMEAGATNDTLSASRNILLSTVVTFSYWIFGSLVLDILVTSILVTSLWRSKTGLLQPDQVVMHVIVITFESAALPSVCMLVAVSLYHARPHIKDHLVLFFVLLTGKLYAIGMLRTLNSRAKLRERMKSHDLGRTSLGEWQWDQETNVNRESLLEPPKTLDISATVRSSSLYPSVSPTATRTSFYEEVAPEDISNSIPCVAARIGETTQTLRFGSPIMNARERSVSARNVNVYPTVQQS